MLEYIDMDDDRAGDYYTRLKEIQEKYKRLLSTLIMCPFCGEIPRLDIGYNFTVILHYMISCSNADCKMKPHTEWIKSIEEVVSIWNMRPVLDFCAEHKPKSKELSYVAHHEWMEKQIQKGEKQVFCYKCRRWLFPCEH